jgi:hypothetical protein
MIKAAREKEKKDGVVEPPPQKAEDLLAEIDEIIGDVKAKRKKNAAAGATGKASGPPKRRYTEDGLPIYTEEELGMNNPKAGTTPLCPFDCDCCH